MSFVFLTFALIMMMFIRLYFYDRSKEEEKPKNLYEDVSVGSRWTCNLYNKEGSVGKRFVEVVGRLTGPYDVEYVLLKTGYIKDNGEVDFFKNSSTGKIVLWHTELRFFVKMYEKM